MLRVGLTGELGSGKSTVARLLAERGAVVLSSDEMARAMMQPGQPVYSAIVDRFGPAVLLPDGELNRPALARLAFNPAQPRVDELNAIIHPAVLAEQERRLAEMSRTVPDAIVVVESALLLTTRHVAATHAGQTLPWRTRFDGVVVVTAPDEVKIERSVSRAARGRKLDLDLEPAERDALRADAEQRLAAQRIPPAAMQDCLLLDNGGALDELAPRVEALWQTLLQRRVTLSKASSTLSKASATLSKASSSAR